LFSHFHNGNGKTKLSIDNNNKKEEYPEEVYKIISGLICFSFFLKNDWTQAK